MHLFRSWHHQVRFLPRVRDFTVALMPLLLLLAPSLSFPLFSGGAPQVETVFVIQAVDATGIFRETGGDVFDIVVRSSTTAATVPVEVTDQEDGKYLVSFTLPDADSEYEISVVFKGTFGGKAGHLRGKAPRRRRLPRRGLFFLDCVFP